MNNLTKYENKNIEIVNLNGKALFNPYDVGDILGIKNVRDNIRNFNNNQVIKIKRSTVGIPDNLIIPPSGRIFLTESGVYKLAFKSRKKEAEKFTDWVTDEVLPTIRKTGQYSIKGEQLELPQYEIKKKTYKRRFSPLFL